MGRNDRIPRWKILTTLHNLRIARKDHFLMPLRPFPYQISLGTDIVHVNRVRAVLQKDQARPGYLERFLRRFLTPAERIEFHKTRESLIGNREDASSKHLAGRWAAKEAVIKAVSWRRLGFHDIKIHRSPNGRGVYAVILDKISNGSGFPGSNVRNLSVDDASDRSQEISSLRTLPVSLSVKSSTEVPESDADDEAKLAEQNRGNDGLDDFGEIEGHIARISISHDGEYATAVCLAAEEPMEGDVGGEAAAREPF